MRCCPHLPKFLFQDNTQHMSYLENEGMIPTMAGMGERNYTVHHSIRVIQRREGNCPTNKPGMNRVVGRLMSPHMRRRGERGPGRQAGRQVQAWGRA